MIASGWINLISIGNDELAERWTAEVNGSDVLAKIALSAYQQGFSQSFTSFAEGSIAGYFSTRGFKNLGRDARNNAYYIFGCVGVQFDLWGRFVHAYAHAAAFPLTSRSGSPRLQHVHRRYVMRGRGRLLGHHRISLLARGSRLDASEILSMGAADIAGRHGLAPAEVVMEEIEDDALPDSRSTHDFKGLITP